MATNNMRNNSGHFPVGSVVKYDFGSPEDTRWLATNGASVSKTTYAPLYALQGDAYEGTGDLTGVAELAGATGKGTYNPRWHPSSNYVAYGSDVATKQVGVASFDGTDLTEVATIDAGNDCYWVDWHPDGNFLAATIWAGKYVKIYSWNGSNSLTEVESVTLSYNAYGVSWHPDGDYLAVGHETGGTDELSVYSWNGSDALAQVATADIASGSVLGVRWSNDGNYLAGSGSEDNNQVRIYSWNGSNALTSVCSYDYGTSLQINSLSWSASDDFLAIGGTNDAKQLVILSFNGSALTERATVDYGTSFNAHVAFSKGSNYLISGISGTSSTVDTVFLYSWVPSSYTLTQVDVLTAVTTGSCGVDINYTNNYMIYSGVGSTASPYDKLYAGTTGLTSCDYRTNFLLQTKATSIVRAK